MSMLDIADYEIDVSSPPPQSPPREEPPALTQMDENLGVEDLGVDEVVQTRVRQTRAKLDASRMLDAHSGIPSLTPNMSRIHMKGKNHERRDLIKLLSAYQMWAHRLFPKANFDDFLTMSTVAGHNPEIRRFRRQAIDNEKYSDGSAPMAGTYTFETRAETGTETGAETAAETRAETRAETGAEARTETHGNAPGENEDESSWLEIEKLQEEFESGRSEPEPAEPAKPAEPAEPTPDQAPKSTEREINSDEEEAAMAAMYDDLGF